MCNTAYTSELAPCDVFFIPHLKVKIWRVIGHEKKWVQDATLLQLDGPINTRYFEEN